MIKKVQTYIIALVTLGILTTPAAFAQTMTISCNLTSVAGLTGCITSAVNFAAALLIIFGVAALLWAGWLYISAGGDAVKVTKAKQAVIYAVIAIFIAIVAAAVPDLLKSIFGNTQL